jgi:hypothetical protein
VKTEKQRSFIGQYLIEMSGKLIVLVGTVCVCACMIGICIVIWQLFHWMRTGVWVPVPLSTVLIKQGANLDSIYNPQSWIGIARIAQWFLEKAAFITIAIITIIVIIAGRLCFMLFSIDDEWIYSLWCRKKRNNE